MRLAEFLGCYFIVIVCFFGELVHAKSKAISKTNEADNDKFELLVQRIELLERRNDETEKKMEQMTRDFDIKERSLIDRIVELEKLNNLRQSGDNAGVNVPDKHHDVLLDGENVKMENDRDPKPEQTRKNKFVSRVRRATVEAEAAFFAKVTQLDVVHLGQNQNIVFDNADTNIGNAYHTTHGIFTAPVDGTYVFCATVAGLHYNGLEYYYAHFDVNGKNVAKFIAHPSEQATQMIVVQLQAGDDVSVKNDEADEHILGNTYSTFSGFLLYQNVGPSTNVLG